MDKKKIIKLIKDFEKKHQYADEEGYTDCSLVENEIFRVSKRKDWLGYDEDYKRAIKEQKERDKTITCYVCEFIKNIREIINE